jgi:hypothetical protein
MEQYMEEYRIVPRPKSAADLKIPLLVEVYSLKTTDIDRVLGLMAKVNNSTDPTGEWPIDTDPLIPWRGANKKNANRDRYKHAHVSLIETAVVAEYRKDMFKDLSAAHLIRYDVQFVLTKHSVMRSMLTKTSSGAVTKVVAQRFIFPDKIKVLQPPDEYPVQSLERLFQTRRQWASAKIDSKDINDIIKFVEKKTVSHAVPGGKFLSRSISMLLTSLVKASRIIHSILIQLHSHLYNIS